MATLTISGSGYNSSITLAKIHAGQGYFKKDTSTTHSQVKLMQQALTDLGYNTQGADGKFGTNTQSAVKAFQTAKGLTSDGYFGQASLAALETALGRHLDPDHCNDDVNAGTGSGTGSNTSVAQAIAAYSSANRGTSNHITKATYFANLDKWAAMRTVKYKSAGTSGTAPNYTAMCCASYPYISRGKRGGSGCTTEYNSYAATPELKGTIASLGGYGNLIPGMEIFQGDSTTKSHMGVYYGTFNFGNGDEPAVYQSSSTRTKLKAKYEDDNKEGPNLTQMNEKWKYWIWPKYVVQ